jgi:pyruvate/2-oxoglutarate dehydrogenase complex dihydrolipoamide dehydrogenase (E3) component
MKHYDAIIIGSGQSGWALAGYLPTQGWKTALIEADVMGGTCVNYGCTPTKTLVASAHAIHMARRGADFGFSAGEITVDMPKVMARVEKRVAGSRDGLKRRLESLDGLDVIYGWGELESATTVRVNGETLSADRIFINTGASASIPPIPGIDTVSYMTNKEILERDTVPEHLVIIGGSYIGLEFAQAFRRFGSEVTIIEMQPRLIAREDSDVSESVREILEAEGINVRTDSECISVAKRGDKIAVDVQCDDGDPEIVGTHLLVATGRKPNTHFGLDKAGIETNERGYIVVNDKLETNVPNIWATGDVNGRGAFTHTSYNEYEILVDILFGSNTRRLSERHMTYGLFIDPPLGRVGMTEQQALEAGHEVLIAKKPMKHIGRAISKAETFGFMKFLVDAKTERFLGAAILGVGGDEIIASVTNLMYANAPYTVFKNAVHIHPTVTELIPTTLGDLKPLAQPEAV